MNKPTEKNKTNRKEIEETKKIIQKQIDAKAEAEIEKSLKKHFPNAKITKTR